MFITIIIFLLDFSKKLSCKNQIKAFIEKTFIYSKAILGIK
jgi:hypothetical protein